MAYEPPSIGVDPKEVVLQPGETLIVYHPHSRCPIRIVSTAELYGPTERGVRDDIKKPEDSYAPFPTRADFEQAEIFANHNSSDKLINDELKFVCRNGLSLKVKTARKMHELLARGVGEDTDDSRVGPIQPAIKISHPSWDTCQFRREEITVPYIQGEFKEDRTYTVRYRPMMDEVLRLIEDPDLRGVLTMHPQRHYVRDPRGGPNMRVWTDLHTADDWWSLQVLFISLVPGSV